MVNLFFFSFCDTSNFIEIVNVSLKEFVDKALAEPRITQKAIYPFILVLRINNKTK